MLNNMGVRVIILLLLVSSNAFSAVFDRMTAINIDLLPNTPITMSNTTGSSVTVYCDIRLVSRGNHSVLIKVLDGTGLVNGSSLRKGQSMVLTVTHGQIIPIIADKNAKAEFVNLASDLIKASCE